MDEKELLGKYKLVLGLEIHLQPKTKTKMFCGCDAQIWGEEPNTHTCPVCLGLPGALPVPNYEAIIATQKLGVALGCKLNLNSKFDRKHYFYPDLPKGYQISQYKQPLCEEGDVLLDSGNIANIERIHLEEDVAKSIHRGKKTLIDFNKSGLPLIEIVSKPCFNNTDDAVDYCHKIQQAVRFLGLGDVDMEKGQMRLEANISLRTPDMENKGELPNYKVEVKNINSFKFMKKAVLFEIKRQREILESGNTPSQENRGYDDVHNKTILQRSKENAHDYRYFPEPDIPPMEFSNEDIENIKKSIPELPWDMRKRLVESYGISSDQSKTLVENLGLLYVKRFEELVKLGLDSKKVANILIQKKNSIEFTDEDFRSELNTTELISDLSILEPIVDEVLLNNQKAVSDYKLGKTASIGFLLGMVQRKTSGKSDTSVVMTLLKQKMS